MKRKINPEISKSASWAAKQRWKRTTKLQRKEVGAMLAEARKGKKRKV